MKYVSLELKAPNESNNATFSMEEFERYIPEEVVKKYCLLQRKPKESFTENLKDNWNAYAPQDKNGTSCKITSVADKRGYTRSDLTHARLLMAQYALNNLTNPQPILENISEKLYEYKAVFHNRLVYLTDEKSINHAKASLQQYTQQILQQQKLGGKKI